MSLNDFFDNETMSVHIKEDNYVYAKKGSPKKWFFTKVNNKKISKEEILNLINEIENNAVIESQKDYTTILQKDEFRVIITMPPFTNKIEITATKPIKYLDLKEYEMPKVLFDRITKSAEGILISGPPGQGKTTFARAIAINYSNNNKIVKTLESPRDMTLIDNITQLALDRAKHNEIRDVLLLTRPDYTIFDEMRNIEDFKLYTDLRLSGIGMIGVLHSTKAIDAIQRFINKIDIGVLPYIIDTIIFIEKGKIAKVLELKMNIKKPYGMKDSGLTRPVISVMDFLTKQEEYEIYSYGEETVVIDLKEIKKNKKNEKNQEIDTNKDELEKNIEIPRRDINFSIKVENRYLLLNFDQDYSNKEILIYIDKNYFMNAKVSKKNIVKINLDSDKGKLFYKALISKKIIEAKI